jgi:hypothetical protein
LPYISKAGSLVGFLGGTQQVVGFEVHLKDVCGAWVEKLCEG